MFKHGVLASVAGGIILSLLTTAAESAQASTLVFSGSGATTNTAFNDFRTAIGGGSRINWDGVRLDGTDVNPNTQIIDLGKTVAIPVDRFQGAGALFSEPYAVSGDGFASVNPDTAGQFPAFSPNNTFVMFDFNSGEFEDRSIDQTFVLPGTNIAAGTRGFGAIFVDVEDPTSSSIEYFGTTSSGKKISLGKFFVPVGASGETQFLGVLFDNPVVTEVELTVGSKALFSFDGTTIQSFGSEDVANGIDLVATDDFVFAVPTLATLTQVPEPTPLSGFGVAAFGVIGFLTRKRLRRI
ncbi:PEP-CTERM sorting domain-containing protein [Anabaena minutissima FACHB-250]|nr:PEP-CTERM sorting domain-containing protein [Anabaena minutissima FACHB-250]